MLMANTLVKEAPRWSTSRLLRRLRVMVAVDEDTARFNCPAHWAPTPRLLLGYPYRNFSIGAMETKPMQ